MSAPSAPRGTVTFLFTDIEGSTRLWQEHPEAMKGALGGHHELLHQAVESNDGYVFHIVGDAFCAAFHTVSAGVGAAVVAQHMLAREPWGAVGPIRVRMAVHTGTAEIRAGEHKSGEYASGLTLSHTARLLSAAHGGQILVSNATQEMLGDDLLATTELRDLGRHRLRDLARAERIFQVVAAGLPAAFPPLKSLETVPNNLIRHLTSFIGRQREIAEAKRLLAHARLLTVAGPGGSGKTRLCLGIATDLRADHPDGVWLLELAPIADPALVVQVLATTLGVREEAGRPPLESVVDHLRTMRTLLLIDNCEHLVDACARLVETVLRACPEVTILASSREPLGLTGAVVFRLPPLSVPEPPHCPPPERCAHYESIRLFIDRAVAVKPDFVLTDTNAAAVVQVCQQLDGIPLAIELAAARVRTIPVQQIAAHLDERFRLVTGGSRTALPRQQTLRGLIDWSYSLLTEAERALFRRLSSFVGGWTLEMAEAVGAGQGVDGQVVDLLERLVDKSLVLADDQGGEARYHMLETIRQYALSKLADTPEGEGVRARHRDVYLAFVEAAAPRLQGREQATWLRRLEQDHDNLRSALRWSLDHHEMEPALRLGGALWLFWDTHGYVREGRAWLDALLALARDRPASAVSSASRRALAQVLDGAATLRARWSEYPAASDLWAQGLAVWRELGDTRGIAEALSNLGNCTRLCGDRARARALVEESLVQFQELADTRGIADAMNKLAYIVADDGDHLRARTLFEESASLFETIEEWRGMSLALDNLGGMLVTQGDYVRAEALHDRSLRLAEQLGHKHGIATALRSLGAVAHHRRDHARARSLYEDSIARFRELNDAFCLAKALVGCALASRAAGDHAQAEVLGDEGLALLRARDAKGELAVRLDELGRNTLEHGDLARATRLFDESLSLQVEAQDARGVAKGLDNLARVAMARGRPSVALRLLAAADAWRRGRGVGRPEVDGELYAQVIAAARAHLDPDVAEAAWSEGAAMTIERAITHARQQIIDGRADENPDGSRVM